MGGIGITACTLLVAGSGHAQDQTQQQIDWCIKKGDASLEQQLVGCTAAIQSGQLSRRDLSLALINRCTVYRHREDHDRAIADCNSAIQLDPNNADAFNNRGLVHRAMGRFDRAIADYNRAIRINPEEFTTFTNRGYAYEQKGDRQRAIADYRKAAAHGDKIALENLSRLGVRP
jgi:tetratricopeptide (TPR) repeat protein